jgi:hypothetical protein
VTQQTDDFGLFLIRPRIKHSKVRWSNFLIQSAMHCTLVEKRAVYCIAEKVKELFVEKNLGVPENWKELYVHLNEEDLRNIGGKKNVPRTYEALKQLGKRFIPVKGTSEKGEPLKGRIHWIDAFFYNSVTKTYDVRISPEILPYMINVTEKFTTIDVGTAMALKSKESQKMYELCCQYSGNYRYRDHDSVKYDNIYKKRVVVISVEKLRQIFCLDEVKDERSGRVEKEACYKNFYFIRKNILKKAQEELYSLYKYGDSDVWFDFVAGPKVGKANKITSVTIFIYTRKHPKVGCDRPWQEGDEELNPYIGITEKPVLTPKQKVHANPLREAGTDLQQEYLARLLNKYLEPDEVAYYMRKALEESRRSLFNQKDSILQVILVIQEKEKQSRFRNGTKAYQRNNLIDYVFTKNLQREFNWSIPRIDKPNHLRRRK